MTIVCSDGKQLNNPAWKESEDVTSVVELKTTDYPMFVLLHCDVNATDWHVIRGFDPDQESLVIETAEDYLTRLPDGSQVGIAEVRRYGIVDRNRR